MTETFEFNDIFKPGIDPYPVYRYFRNQDPVHWSPEIVQAWFIFNYADVREIKQDDVRFSSAVIPKELQEVEQNTLWQVEAKGMLFLDSVDHTIANRLVRKAFKRELYEGMASRIQELADNLLDQVKTVGQMDVNGDLATPLTVIQVCDLLGMPPGDIGTLKGWSVDIFAGLDPWSSEEQVAQAHASSRALVDYLRSAIEDKRKNPRPNDFVSALLLAEENGVKLTEEHMISNLFQMYVGGHDEAANLIGNGILALLRNPDQLKLLQNNPSLIGNAVQEFLRYDAPLLGVSRLATDDVSLSGKTIQKGQRVFLLYGAANRDPKVFPDPDKVDITRPNSAMHTSVGYGTHYCIGARLGWLQAEIAINTLIQRFPDLRLDTDQLQWRQSFNVRTLNALPIAFTPTN